MTTNDNALQQSPRLTPGSILLDDWRATVVSARYVDQPPLTRYNSYPRPIRLPDPVTVLGATVRLRTLLFNSKLASKKSLRVE